MVDQSIWQLRLLVRKHDQLRGRPRQLFLNALPRSKSNANAAKERSPPTLYSRLPLWIKRHQRPLGWQTSHHRDWQHPNPNHSTGCGSYTRRLWNSPRNCRSWSAKACHPRLPEEPGRVHPAVGLVEQIHVPTVLQIGWRRLERVS